MIRPVALFCGFLVAYLNVGCAFSSPFYTVTDLGVEGTAKDINNSGQIVGNLNYSGNDMHAFLYSEGNVTDLGTLPGGVESSATAINDTGEIVGSSCDHAYLYVNGAMTDLGTLGGHTSYAYGINNGGQVVGVAWTAAAGNYSHAFIYDHGTIADLGTLGGNLSWATCVNNSGVAAGWSRTVQNMSHVCLFHDGSVTDLGTLPGCNYGDATAINDKGQVVGTSTLSGGSYLSFLYSDGYMADLGTLGGVAPGQGTLATDINNSGQVVGESYVPGSVYYHAFLYDSGIIRDLNDLIDPVSSSGWLLCQANAINDSGMIVGAGLNPNNQWHAFLLTPTPEPSTVVLSTVGAISLLFYLLWKHASRNAVAKEQS